MFGTNICCAGDDYDYPYVDLNDYYDKHNEKSKEDKYCSHSWETYAGFTETYSYCTICGKTENEILNRK